MFKFDKIEVSESFDVGSVEAKDEKIFESVLKVPEVPTTILEGEVVDVFYYLQVKVNQD